MAAECTIALSDNAPRSGRGGRRFKSCHSDQTTSLVVDFPQLSATPSELAAPRVHKRIHKRVLRMVTVRQDNKGNYSARKRLPADVREEYGRRHGQRLEAKSFAPASVGAHAARQMFRDWETEVSGRIAARRRIIAAAERHSSAQRPQRPRGRTFVGVPPRIAGFTGRADALDRLDAILTRDKPAAVTQVNNQQVEILVTDINMPEIGGYELAEKARRMKKDLQVILLSGRETNSYGFPWSESRSCNRTSCR